MHPDARVRERSFGEWEGISVEELAQRYPEDYRSWAEFRGGELKYGAEPKEEVGRRGVEALNDWAFRAGRDTDLYVFSHGAWISQTLQTLLGMADAHGDFADILSMRNAHWVRLIPLEIGSALRWRLMDYNHGPAIADTEEWEHPNL
ncbi:bifunctional RNase H/acid phosphatase [Bifidobacterium catenulatum]|nr:bifunctional RNase H/acid phosphatase [Bifidobacterium catenulatum]